MEKMDEKFSIELTGDVVTFRRMGRVNEYEARPELVRKLSGLVNAGAREGHGTLTAFKDGWAYVAKGKA